MRKFGLPKKHIIDENECVSVIGGRPSVRDEESRSHDTSKVLEHL